MTEEKTPGISRRTLLTSSLALAAARVGTAQGASDQPKPGPHVAVVGAGAFGGWTAYELLRRGARVSLFDAWGPGNGRASSGGETRVIRTVYGVDELFTDLALRALELWQIHEKRFRRPLYRRTGMLVLGADPLILDAMPLLAERGVEIRELDLASARRRFPQIDFDGLDHVYEDQGTGYLLARQACRTVVEHFVDEGGDFRRASVRPGPIEEGHLQNLELSDGSRFAADHYVFACGSWMGRLFPKLLVQKIRPTRQEVHYFGPPAGDGRFSEDTLPIWTDRTSKGYYGIPGNLDRGFKIAKHALGEPFDPSTSDRLPDPSQVESARAFLGRRFPAMAGAPLIESRVCHYANTADAYFVADRHPEAHNLWLLGGGSGHGFKHGPALGERMAQWVLGEAEIEPRFRLDAERGSQA